MPPLVSVWYQAVKSTLGVNEVVDKQVIARGKPERFDDARDLAIRQVKLLEAGQGNVIGTRISITGRAKNENIKNLIDKSVQKNLPAGFTGSTNILYPKPEPAPEPAVVAEECQANIEEAINGRQVLFETDKAVIKSESEGLLKEIADAASKCPALRIEIAGHTDSRGRDAYNQELSEARATSVKSYLAKVGVDIARLDAKGIW